MAPCKMRRCKNRLPGHHCPVFVSTLAFGCVYLPSIDNPSTLAEIPLFPCLVDVFGLLAPVKDRFPCPWLLKVHISGQLSPVEVSSIFSSVAPHDIAARPRHEKLAKDSIANPEIREPPIVIFVAAPYVVNLSFVGVFQVSSRTA